VSSVLSPHPHDSGMCKSARVTSTHGNKDSSVATLCHSICLGLLSCLSSGTTKFICLEIKDHSHGHQPIYTPMPAHHAVLAVHAGTHPCSSTTTMVVVLLSAWSILKVVTTNGHSFRTVSSVISPHHDSGMCKSARVTSITYGNKDSSAANLCHSICLDLISCTSLFRNYQVHLP